MTQLRAFASLLAAGVLLVAGVLLPSPAGAGADAGGYEWFDEVTGGPAHSLDDLTGAATLALDDEDVSGLLPLGFSFTFYGAAFSSVVAGSNGYLTFDEPDGPACCGAELPSVYAPANMVAALWGDLDPSAGGTVRYATLGPEGSRRFVVEWKNVPYWGSSETATVQAKLFEDGAVEVHVESGRPSRTAASIGIQNGDATTGLTWKIVTAPLAASAVRFEVTDRVCSAAPAPAPLSFEAPVMIDRGRAGGEPVSVVADDGSIVVSAHAGTTHVYKEPSAAAGAGDFAVGYFNQTLNWRSEDGGRSWSYVGLAGTGAGPHSPTGLGFSDPDLTKDAGGRLYNVEIDLANITVFSSPDDGRSWPVANPIAASGDRPWLAATEADEVYLLVASPRQLWRSRDGGVTFSLVSFNAPVDGKIIADPQNPDDGLIGPVGRDAIGVSADDGATWKVFRGAGLGPSQQFFGAVAADRSGRIYMASAGGYGGGADPFPNGRVTFNSFDRATGTWGRAVDIPTPEGDALWPWIIAGDDGRVAVAWYQTLASRPGEFRIYVAVSTNGGGSLLECSDGRLRYEPPAFAVADAAGRPIHVGQICLSGLACNARTGDPGDRRLGDFFTVNFDHTGRVFVVSGDTTVPSLSGGPKPVSNPIFIAQAGGDRLLAAPDPVRPTRCLWPLPC